LEYRKSNTRTRSYKTRVFMTLVLFFAIMNHALLYAQEKERLGCVFSLEKTLIHFTAYQPHINNTRLCRKLPEATGITYFSLDLMDKALRKLDLNIKVTSIGQQGDGEFQTLSPIVDFKISSSRSGVVAFEHDFKGFGGRYRLDVTNEADNTQGSFVFEVGIKEFKWTGKFGQMVAFGLFALFGLVILGYITFFRKKKVKDL